MKDAILELIAPLIKTVLGNVLRVLFGALVEKNPEHGKVAIASLYPIVDVELEALVEGTPNKVDDAVCEAVMEAIENVAAENNIQLSNVDTD